VWTPDGERITFKATDGSLQWKLADGGGPAEVLRPQQGEVDPMAWLPDGSAFAYLDDGGFFLWSESAQDELFLGTPELELAQSFSPDSRFLAYTSSESGRTEVYVTTLPDPQRGRWQVSKDGGDEPVFSPDGRELFYRSLEKMVAVRIQLEPTFRLGEQTELFSNTFLRNANAPAYDYDAENERFLMVQRPEEAMLPRIHVVLNWFDELERLVPTEN
jgi:serine/threonine-protein kinase